MSTLTHGRSGRSFRRSALVLALGAVIASGAALAQKATGEIFGHAGANASVTIENTDTGLTREITADASGRFSFSQLPTGHYRVTSDGATRDVQVKVGTGSEVNFADKDSQKLEAIEVTGNAINPIDVSSVESSTVFTADQIAALPVARDISSVALLAPGTVRGDSGFESLGGGPLASFGGASVAENGYYINGFDVTNIRNFTSFANLPFEAIGEQQVKTGGYGAEFGRSLGGVINIVTKRGTNEFKGV
ncbi:TonB-dependent receptor [Tahibacter amnicola]|uniref:Plug and carboxypeptidase regulatory-like domain-containing protein n=1 Tax=Tahibacter amnicola TaxID=2976241 RepID=A0ABY6BHQ8_9GAMM|nr:Plug and carboxypeptidase regulatory-like domain-containing protein [Tahibacter amnicola]UXI68615.1 Plug and carboxypeptidase regulatory-like domain-containing protein [Tahibacter amnicola]